jgi:anti-sigma regulatory factor (Ser/Thr protein kinase)
MDDVFHRTIANDFANLHELMEEATRFLESRGVDDRAVYLVNLGIEETVTNIVKYAYSGSATHTIDVKMTLTAEEVAIVIIDDGLPFNPVVHERKPLGKVEDREIGGLGIHLMKRQLDCLEHRRESGRNILEIKIWRKLGLPHL